MIIIVIAAILIAFIIVIYKASKRIDFNIDEKIYHKTIIDNKEREKQNKLE